MEWISVKDRMPELGEKVLVHFAEIDNTLIAKTHGGEAGDVWSVYFADGEAYNTGDYAEEITHWMPLPSPPNP